ncbi:MAG: S8 family serine peptidase [Pseudobdellovibrionaceae bacterium]
MKKFIFLITALSFVSNAWSQDLTPNDPLFEKQWHLKRINAPAAWSLQHNLERVKVLVCDSGIESSHPDLKGLVGLGKNFVDGSANTEPGSNGHGTRAAGVIAANSNNGFGIAGLASHIILIPGKVTMGPEGSPASTEAMVACIQYAIDQRIRIVNMSYYEIENPAVMAKAAELHKSGGMLFLPIGNDGLKNSGKVIDLPITTDAVVVASTDFYDFKAMSSAKGKIVDLAAPGDGIWTTNIGGGFKLADGTSYATPLVAGAAAYLLGLNPNAPIDDVIDILRQTAVHLGTPGRNIAFGNGRIDLGKAVEVAVKKWSK